MHRGANGAGNAGKWDCMSGVIGTIFGGALGFLAGFVVGFATGKEGED